MLYDARVRQGAVLFAALFTLAACSGSSAAPPSSDGGTEPAARPSDPAAAAARAACSFKRGALPADTLGASSPTGDAIPIDTIVVLMQENRSFDSYFGHLGKFANRTDIESAPDDTTNPASVGDGNPTGVTHPYQHAPQLCSLDTAHEWSATHVEWDNGLMDGFFYENNGFGPLPPMADPSLADGERALWWYDERDIPFYYALASTFAIGDHYHASILGPTWPNRMYLYAATSFGRTTGELPDVSAYPYPAKDAAIFDELEKAHVSWNIYGDGAIGAEVVFGPALFNRYGRNPILAPEAFVQQAAAGTLPQVAFVDPHLGAQAPGRNDEHPPADIQVGEEFVSQIVLALFRSPVWPHAAMFLTYDEHGGMYDHVAPPATCSPDTTAPILAPGDVTKAGFDRYGVRVPMTVISPYARPAFVSHVVHDHTSVTRFIETRFDLPALTARDANADPMLEFFDFTSPAFLTPPNLAAPAVDPTALSFCAQTYMNVPTSP